MFDVCILGAGPAGVATAARLADAGATVTILDRPVGIHPWVGETFSGAIREPLMTLRMWEAFCSAGHVRGHEIRAAWGAAEPHASSMIFRPHGHTWHVDRARFDLDLRTAAAQRGCIIQPYHKLLDIRHEGSVWNVRLDEGAQLRARFLIDATGRSCALGRRLGVSRRHFDRLIALIARVPCNPDPSYGNAIFVEATPDGWWYAAPVPGAHVIAYLTDRDLLPPSLKQMGLRIVAADSALTLTSVEEQSGWLPVGDAFAAHDPLCGWGVARALNNGIRAADAVLAFLQTFDPSSLHVYRRDCIDQFERYLEGLTHQYSLEGRWPTSSFWARRARALTVAK